METDFERTETEKWYWAQRPNGEELAVREATTERCSPHIDVRWAVGTVLAPRLTIALLWAFADNIHTVLWFAVVLDIIAVLLLLKVPEPADHEQRPTAASGLIPPGHRRAGALTLEHGYRNALIPFDTGRH